MRILMKLLAAPVHHKNAIGIFRCGDPLGHHDLGPALQLLSQPGPEPGLCEKIQGGEAVIKHVNGSVLDEGPGDSQPLPLATGQIGSG